MTSALWRDVASQRERAIAAEARLSHWERTVPATTRRHDDGRGRARLVNRLRALMTRA